MDDFERTTRRREAQRRLSAKRRRAGQLRGRVVATSLIGFVVLWGVVFVQMAIGNDPVLGTHSRTAAAPPAEADGRRDSAQGSRATSNAGEALATTDPEETEAEAERGETTPPEAEALVPSEPEEALEREPTAEAEPEVFEPEPIETTQS
jgi:hypothetical protein